MMRIVRRSAAAVSARGDDHASGLSMRGVRGAARHPQTPRGRLDDLDIGHTRNDWPKVADRRPAPANNDGGSSSSAPLFAVEEAAARLGVSLTTVYREIHDNKLKATKIRGQWRISETQLADYRRACERPLVLPGHHAPARKAS